MLSTTARALSLGTILASLAAGAAHGQAAQVLHRFDSTTTFGGNPGDKLGVSTPLGDLDGNGFGDLAVGAPGADVGQLEAGEVHVLLLGASGIVGGTTINDLNGLSTPLVQYERFGTSLASLGDFDGNGTTELVVGTAGYSNSTVDRIHILSLDAGGTPVAQHVVDTAAVPGGIPQHSGFGLALANVGDLDGDGRPELAVGLPYYDGGGIDRGALWILSFDPTTFGVTSVTKIGEGQGGFTTALRDQDWFGWSVVSPGDLDGNGHADLAVGVPGRDRQGEDRGGVFLLLRDGSGVIASPLVTHQRRGFDGILREDDYFGSALAAPGDVDGDGVADLIVGAPGADDERLPALGNPAPGFLTSGPLEFGAAWILHLDANARVTSTARISTTFGGLQEVLDRHTGFGGALAMVGDLDGDGKDELAVGANASSHSRGGSLYLLSFDDSLSASIGTVYRGGATTDYESLRLGSGPPSPGSNLVLALDDPPSGASVPILLLSASFTPGYVDDQSGFLFPGLDPTRGLYVNLGDLVAPAQVQAPGTYPAVFSIPVPMTPALVGRRFVAQGLFFDAVPVPQRNGASYSWRATRGAELQVGP